MTAVNRDCGHITHTTFGSVEVKITTTTSVPLPMGRGKIPPGPSTKEIAIEILTENLRICPVSTREWEAQLIAMYGDEVVNKFVGNGVPTPADKIAEKIGRWNSRLKEGNPFVGYVITERTTGEFVGDMVLKPFNQCEEDRKKDFVPGVVEVGYMSVKKHWGKKYAQECGHAFIYHFLPALQQFGVLVEGHRITKAMATTRADNVVVRSSITKFMEFIKEANRYNDLRAWYEVNLPYEEGD